MIFEGEYLNGLRNGKGKEYILDGKLEYDGEYLYNKKWNGKEYDKNGKIINVLKNGNGKVKEYNYEGKLMFEGEYLNEKRWNGKGKECNYHGELVFEGE